MLHNIAFAFSHSDKRANWESFFVVEKYFSPRALHVDMFLHLLMSAHVDRDDKFCELEKLSYWY